MPPCPAGTASPFIPVTLARLSGITTFQVASIPSRRRPRPLLAPGASTDRWSTVRPGHPLHAPLYNIPVVFFPLPDTSAPPSNLNLRFPPSPVPFGSEATSTDEILAAVGAHSAAQCVVLFAFPLLPTAPLVLASGSGCRSAVLSRGGHSGYGQVGRASPHPPHSPRGFPFKGFCIKSRCRTAVLGRGGHSAIRDAPRACSHSTGAFYP